MIKKTTTSLLTFYKIFISSLLLALLGPACRFEETCSEYTKRKINEEGALKGTYLGIVRILKCQPYYKGNLRREIV